MPAQTRKQIATEFLTLAAAGKVRQAYDKHIGRGFRHHNPYFRGDAHSLMEGMRQNAEANPGKTFKVHRALEDGDYVAVFSEVHMKPEDRGVALVHTFRFEGEHIAELWDIGQPVPENAANENGMF